MDAINSLVKQKIKLVESSHEYILQSDPSIHFNSVTEIVDSHFKPFDKWRIAKKLTSYVPKYKHLSAEELVDQWNETRDRGIDVHKQIEQYIINGRSPTCKKSQHGVEAVKKIRENFGDNLYSEVIVFSEKQQVAGQIDLIVHNNNNNTFYIYIS